MASRSLSSIKTALLFKRSEKHYSGIFNLIYGLTEHLGLAYPGRFFGFSIAALRTRTTN